MNKSSKIYIAGHQGLVGSAIVKNLKLKGYTNLVCRTHKELDLIDQAATRLFLEKEKPEYVILAAAKVGGIIANNTYRANYIYENLAIQNNVIHQSYISGVKKLLFLGSSCIYPKESPQPISENYLLTSSLEYTNEPYAIAKIAGMKMCESYNLQYGTNFISVTPTNIYGPNDNFDLEKAHVLSSLIRKIYCAKLLNENQYDKVIKNVKSYNITEAKKYLADFGVEKNKVEIWGSGNPRREFLYSEDMADACIFLLEHINFKDTYNKNDKDIKNTHINIGCGKDISIKDLARLIQDIIGFEGKFYFNKNKPDGTMLKLTNTSKLHSFGWKHKIKLEDGVKKMCEWYLNNYEQKTRSIFTN